MPEVSSHPIRSRQLRCIRSSDLPLRRFILRLPAECIVVATVAEVQKTPRRHQELQRRIQFLSYRRTQRTGIRPIAQLAHGRDQRQPARHVVIAQPTRGDRKSTRLNSSHQIISYAVFCLKKKKWAVDKTGKATE